jgi:RNA polymerase sigma-70 factor (ECF subfamily)
MDVGGERGEFRLDHELLALFDQYRAGLLRYLLSFRVNLPEAEEIVQETFLALFLHLRRDKPRDNLRGWIFKTAHNMALKNRGEAQRRVDELPEPCADSAPDPEERLQAIERRDRLLSVVSALSETDRRCLLLRAEGLRYREIAEILGISLGKVAGSLENSLARLKRSEQVAKSYA